MKVVIPVAGEGRRLRPHTNTVPKPLLEVAGKPILAHILDPLLSLNIDEVIFVIGYLGNQIREYVSENYSFKSSFVNQDKLLGLGYAVSLALDNIEESDLLIILGDTIAECDLGAFTTKADYVLGVKQVADPRRFGIADIKDGIVTKLVEKPKDPPGNLALIGLYYFKEIARLKNELAKLIKSDKKTSGEIQLTDGLQKMIESGTKFRASEVSSWHDCGKKETILKSNEHFLKSADFSGSYNGSKIVSPVHISESAEIIKSTIGPNVSIAGSVSISDSVIANSIIGESSTVKNADLKDSLIGKSVLIRNYKGTLNLGDNSIIEGS
ncbi:MAG: NTP transferase domain-containing protein [candidate division Zixibacteria bacterium]|nr:NTP transferase domain-containing protein [candidate division Zixibacteria bacterium]